MDAHFYIIPESFTNKQDISELTNVLEAFLCDYYNLLEYKTDNKVFLLDDTFSVPLMDGIILADYLYDLSKVQGKEREIRRTLGKILNELPKQNKSIEDIKAEIATNSENKCTGILSMTPIPDIAGEHQIVYDKNSWFDFRRFHLGLFPGDAKNYVDECIKYYPDFFFHQNNYESIKPLLKKFSQKIVYHLSALHDIFPRIKAKYPHLNHTQLLQQFSIVAKLDEGASLQGNTKFQNNIRFKFIKINSNGKEDIEELICEPHIKLCRDNDNNNTPYYFHRIYFHFNGKKEIHDGKILIAHIGKHLDY
jgi:hypothetical protein